MIQATFFYSFILETELLVVGSTHFSHLSSTIIVFFFFFYLQILLLLINNYYQHLNFKKYP